MREPDGTGAAACEPACVVARERLARHDVADGTGTHRSRDGSHCEEDGSQALGAREEGGHRQREGRPQGPVVGAEGATRKRGVQEEGRRLQGAENRRQPPVAVDEGGVEHQVRPRLAQQRRALSSPQVAGKAVRRGVRPHHRQEAPGHRGGQAILQPASATAKRRPPARAAPKRGTAATPRAATTGRRAAAPAKPTTRKPSTRKTPARKAPARKAPARKAAPAKTAARKGATAKRATTQGATTKAAGRQAGAAGAARKPAARKPAAKRRTVGAATSRSTKGGSKR